MMKDGLKLSVTHIMEEFSRAGHQYARVFVCFARMKIHLFLNESFWPLAVLNIHEV